jgi:UDP-glucose 4-epimerase
VLEVVAAFECASGCRIPLRFADRRQGDVAASYADPTLAESLLGWRAELGIERMCGDAWSRYKRLFPA